MNMKICISHILDPTPKMENSPKISILDVKLNSHIFDNKLFALMSIAKHGKSFMYVLSVCF